MSNERGSGTVLVVGIVAALLALTVGALTVLGARQASTTARTAADLAALAGAQDGLHGGDACGTAAAVAAANGARLRSCAVEGEAVVVVAAVPAPARIGHAVARARAGPAPVGDSVQPVHEQVEHP